MIRRWTTAWMIFWMTIAPAQVLPEPHSEEWWFGRWGIEDKVWPIAKGQGVTVAVLDSGVNAQLPD
jgi:hypothetical protein